MLSIILMIFNKLKVFLEYSALPLSAACFELILIQFKIFVLFILISSAEISIEIRSNFHIIQSLPIRFSHNSVLKTLIIKKKFIGKFVFFKDIFTRANLMISLTIIFLQLKYF